MQVAEILKADILMCFFAIGMLLKETQLMIKIASI